MRLSWLRLLILTALMVGASALLSLSVEPSSAELRHAVRQAHWLAPAAFVAIYIGWTMLLLPGVVPTLAGGALFGVVAGSLLSLVGAVAGATLAFAIARRLGRAPIKELSGSRGARLEDWLSRRGFVALVYARLLPVVPFNVLNYAAGLAGMPTRSYVLATALGIVPGTIAYTVLGSAATHPSSVPFLVSASAIVLLAATVGVVSRRRRALARL